MRLAWQGATPTEEDGVGYAATQLLLALADEGVEIDCFLSAGEEAVPERLRSREELAFVCIPPRWAEGRWYSSGPLFAFTSGQAARALVQRRLAEEVARLHERRRYDLLYQFSQIELFGIRRLRERLPPIVLHPQVHIAGELAWHRREAHLARRCESRLRTAAVRALLQARSLRQLHDAQLARLVVAPSRRFATLLSSDYGIAADRLVVAPDPIDLERFSPARDARPPEPLELLFVSRIAMRKGVDMTVALSHRLVDLAGRIRIVVVGERSLFSDYRPLLRDLEPAVATYVGGVQPADLPETYRRAALVLQPSYYEPFALTVGEALASGLPVAASDEVGAVEDVEPAVCSTFPAGDVDAFEAVVRTLVHRLEAGEERARLAAVARSEAERRFAPGVVAGTIVDALSHVAGTTAEPAVAA